MRFPAYFLPEAGSLSDLPTEMLVVIVAVIVLRKNATVVFGSSGAVMAVLYFVITLFIILQILA